MTEKWVSVDSDHLEKYHTDRDCPFFPSEAREMTDAEERRNLSECSQCKGTYLAHELAGD